MSEFWLPKFLMDGHHVRLTPTERDIFAALFNARGGVLNLAEMHDLWCGRPLMPEDANRTLMVHVVRLRQKLRPTRFRVANLPHRGYRMERVSAVRVAA